MKSKYKPRITPQLGALPVAKFKSRYPHVEALVECGGQISLSGRGLGDAFAFGSKGFWAAVKVGGGGLVDTSLRRLDWAIAIGNQTKVRVDEISGAGGGVIAGGPRVEHRPMLRFPRIQSLIDGGSTICFGDCKPGAAIASKEGTGLVAILARRTEEDVLSLLQRLDWSIGLAESQGKCIDEVFHGIAPLPKRKASAKKAAAKKSIPKTPMHVQPFCADYRGDKKGYLERVIRTMNSKNIQDTFESAFAAPKIYLVKTNGLQSTKKAAMYERQPRSRKRPMELPAPALYEWGKIDGKWQIHRKKPTAS